MEIKLNFKCIHFEIIPPNYLWRYLAYSSENVCGYGVVPKALYLEQMKSLRQKKEEYFRYHKNHNNDVSTLSLGIESGKLLRMSFNFSRFFLIISLLILTYTHSHTHEENHKMRRDNCWGPPKNVKTLFHSFSLFFHVLPHRFSSSFELFCSSPPWCTTRESVDCDLRASRAGPTRCCVSAVYSVQFRVRQRQKCVNEGER